MNDGFEDYRLIDKELEAIGTSTFRKAPFTGWSQVGNHFESHLSRYNGEYLESDYFYKAGRTFLHFTKIQFLFSILNARAFRFYDLNSSTDPSEYEYAASILKIRREEINSLKSNVFTFSFCPIDELTNDYVWQHYGSNYAGAAIIFEIVNDPAKWHNYHMSQVHYKVPEPFSDYSLKLEELSKSKNISARIDLSRLLAFHKQEKFNNEKEVRLLTYNPFNTFYEKMKFSKFDYRLEDSRNRFTKYFEYPLWVDNSSNMLKSLSPEIDRTSKFNEQYFEDKPKIIIKDIRVGYNAGLNYEEFRTFREEIEMIIAYNYGYHVKVSPDLIEPQRG